MTIRTEKNSALSKTNLDLLIIPVQGKVVAKNISGGAFKAEVAHHLHQSDLTDQAGSSVVFYPQTPNQTIKRICLVQMGKAMKLESLAKVVKNQASKYKRVGVVLPQKLEKECAHQVIAALYAGTYQFHEHKSSVSDVDKSKLTEAIIFSDIRIDKLIDEATAIAESVAMIKNLAHLPANALTPKAMADRAEQLGKQLGFSVTVFNENELEKMGMGGITSVSRGSDEPAQLIVMDYNPKAKPTVALVGKGITFDSGGISIKPSKDMHEMKFDMIGGASVMAIVEAAAKLKLPVHIIGIVAASENLPSGKAIKPGDVVTMYSGKTVEVVNTDAEGRMVVADGLTYAQKHFKPDYIIDVATLTGAVIISLGNKISGAFGNNKAFNQQIMNASKVAEEDIHFLPLFKGYADELKSPVADFANIGKQRFDALIGALFLEKFIEKDIPWVHFDIAGTAWDNNGPTGVILTTIIEFLKKVPKQ